MPKYIKYENDFDTSVLENGDIYRDLKNNNFIGIFDEEIVVDAEHSELIHILGSKQDIIGFKQFVRDNKSTEKPIDQRFNNMFAKYGVELPINEIMSKIYPYINESFSGIKVGYL